MTIMIAGAMLAILHGMELRGALVANMNANGAVTGTWQCHCLAKLCVQ